jgi:hypothetical protein
VPITTNFSSSQNYGDISVLTLTDTSTGSGTSITGRLVYIQKADGTYLTPEGSTTDYIFWPYVAGAGDTINIDVLDRDYALDISVKSFVGSTIYQTVTTLCLFSAYSELFLRQLTQAQEGNNQLLSNKNFWGNKFKLRTLVDDATQAVASLNDQTIAQFALDEAKKLTDNVSTFF